MSVRSTLALVASLAALGGTGYLALRPVPTAQVTSAAVRAALMADPRIIVEVANTLREQEDSAQRQASVAAVAAVGEQLWTERDMVIGNREARRTAVEFFDYQCGYCRAAKSEIDAMLRADRDLRIVLRPLPILGPVSMLAARASLAAGLQGKGEAMHEALFARPLPLSEGAVNAAAAEAGVDLERMRRDMDSDHVRRAIEESVDVARRLRMEGTPGFAAQGVGVMMGYGTRERFMAFVRAIAEASGGSAASR